VTDSKPFFFKESE